MTTEMLKPGLVADMPMDGYRAVSAVSASDLRNLQRSPAYAHMREHVSTPAQEWGTAVHAALLEPMALEARYRIDPECPERGGFPAGWRNTKAYKSQREELLSSPGVVGLLTAQQFDDLRYLRDRFSRTEIGRTIESVPGVNEASVFGCDTDHDLWIKCRPDRYIESAAMVVDIKTTQDHRPGAFARSCKTYSYHVTQAHYVRALECAGLECDHYVFVVLAADAPYEIAAYTLDLDSVEQGRYEREHAMRHWRECLELGEWPGVSNRIEEIRLPEYAITFYREDS